MVRPKRSAGHWWPRKQWVAYIVIPLVTLLIGIGIGHYSQPAPTVITKTETEFRDWPVYIPTAPQECRDLVPITDKAISQSLRYIKIVQDAISKAANQQFTAAQTDLERADSENRRLEAAQRRYLEQAEKCDEAE